MTFFLSFSMENNKKAWGRSLQLNCSVLRPSPGRLFTRNCKETQGSLAASNSEEFKHQVEFDFVPEPFFQGLIWKL